MAATGVAVNAAATVWTPFKDLQAVLEDAIHKRQPDAVHDLEVMLRKHKADCLALGKHLPKNATHRDVVRKSTTVGLAIHGEQRTQTFPQAFIEEALILSDLFELNELAALELLIAGEANRPDFPGLTRGLVAVLLYYDGRRSVVGALRTLLFSLEGRTWTLGLPRDLTQLTDTFIQQLTEENLVNKILAYIKDMNTTKELDKLQNNRALGPPKHRKQVQEMFEETQKTCADCMFCLACQRPLSKADTLQLIAHLRASTSLQAGGGLPSVTLTLLMALLYCFDVSVLEREDSEELTATMPVFSDASYISDIHKELRDDSARWGIPGLKATAQFAWSILLRQLSQYPLAAGAGEYYEEDELLIDAAVEGGVFSFLGNAVLPLDKFHNEEFYLRRIHGLLTDFIYQMPLKVKEVRNRGDETARIMMVHLQEGQEPPASLRRDFEHLLYLIGDMYKKDPLQLELALDYWCPPDPAGGQHESFMHRPPQKQVALYKFVRMAGDLLPAPLYVPYINMLAGLTSGSQSAQHCYNLLKLNGTTSSTVSWDHIFISLNQYYTGLRREAPGASHDPAQGYRTPHSRTITPQELEGLISVLQLLRKVCEQSEVCRVQLDENQQWSVMMLLVGLVTCSVPPQMKAEILHCLAAFGRTPHIAVELWQVLEAAQVLSTVPAAAGQSPTGGIQVELEEIEARNETFPITRAFLSFLTALTDTPVPPALGAGSRAPGFQPYLEFVRDNVFLSFGSRAYKNPAEKWQVASLSLGVLRKLLHGYEVQADHFVDQDLAMAGAAGGSVVANKPAGFVILVHMLKDSRLLQMIFRILDDAMKHFETYTNIPGGDNLEKTALLCLQMLEDTLETQDLFIDMVRETGSSLLLNSMDRLLLGINPRTQKSDYITTVAKYLMFNSTMPEHALAASRILYLASRSGPIQPELVTLFTENKETSEQLLHGFVECLDCEDVEEEEHMAEDGGMEAAESSQGRLRNATRQHLVRLMLYALDQATPNLAHFLLGFELRKPIAKTNLQDPGVLNSPKTCLHSILGLLGRGLTTRSGPSCLSDTPTLAGLGLRLIYTLAANRDTSLPTLRYLRTSHDFLYRHLQHVPYDAKDYKHPVSKHQSWLMKTLAVELRVTSLNRQRSHTQRLMKLLLDDYDEDQTSVLQPVADESEVPFSRYGDQSTSLYGRTVRGRQFRRRLMSLLDAVDFHQDYPMQLNLEFFDTRLVTQVMSTVERRDEAGITYFDIKALHRILTNELNNQQGLTMAGQRQMIEEEIRRILATTLERNRVCQSLHEKHEGFEAWRQVTEVVLTACPGDLLQGEMRQTVLLEILQELLMKVADDKALTDLTAPVSGVILTLMANLRHCFLLEDSEVTERDKRDSRYISLLDNTAQPAAGGGGANTVTWGQGSGSSGSRTQFSTSLQIVLKGLIEHIMRSSGGQQRVRAKLYGALLYYLQIASKPKVSLEHLQEETSSSIEKRLQASSDTEYEQLRKENLSTILMYGDTFMDLVCRDACDGIDVGRMLSLSVLDSILTMDKFSQWLMFLSSKGYLQHLVDSLVADDDKLLSVLAGGADNLKVLYLFESKMSLLTRVAETATGASTLLRCGVMQQLAACTFFDMRPDIDRSGMGGYQPDDQFLPDPASRYRHLLSTTLKFCLAILTSLGVENSDAGTQVMQFVVAHADVFNTILRDRQLSLNLHWLRELALTTAVLARANSQDENQYEYNEGETAAIEFRGHRSRIQRQMIALLPKYCLSEKLYKQLRNLELQGAGGSGGEGSSSAGGEGAGRDARAEVLQAYLEVGTNVTSYCRALVSRAGSVQYCRVLFGPGLEEGSARDLHGSGEFSMSSLGPAQAPNLGVVVYQLKQCTSQFLSVYETRKHHLAKLEGLKELSVEDLKQFSGVLGGEKMSSQQRQVVVRRRLSQLIAYNYRELQAYAYMIENSLFLLWRHLEYYLKHCVPTDRQHSQHAQHAKRQAQIRRLQDIMGVAQSPGDRDRNDGGVGMAEVSSAPSNISQREIDTLKQAAVAVCSESMFKKIQEINQTFCKSRSHYGFVEAVIRQIKRLLRLHTG